MSDIHEAAEGMARAFFEEVERRAAAEESEASGEPVTPMTWDELCAEGDQDTLIQLFSDLIDAKVLAPYDGSKQALIHRTQEQFTALIAAYEVIKMVPAADARVAEGAQAYAGLVTAASRWVTRFGALAKPPLEVTVEDDEDPEGAGVESEFQVTEHGE